MRRTNHPTPGKGRRAGVFWRGRAGYFGGVERGASHVTTPCDLLTHAQCRHRVGTPSPPPRYRRRFSYTRILGDLIVLVSTVHIFNAFHIKDVAGCSKYTFLAFCGPCTKILIHHQLKVQLQEHANQKFSAIEKHVLGVNPPVTSQPSSTYNSILDLWEEHQKNLPAPRVFVQCDNCILQ